MTSYIDLIRIGDARTDFLKAALASEPLSDVREAMMEGLPLRIEMYRRDMAFGDRERYAQLIEETSRALSALENGEEFVYRGMRIPAE